MTLPASVSPLRTRLARPGRRARIGLTPLIDVVFILLVFFMLASSFLDERAIEVAKPAVRLGGSSLEGALLVELRSDGLRLSGIPVTPEELTVRLGEHADRNPDQRVVIKPAPGVALQQAVILLDRVAASGLGPVSFTRHPAN